ncbi:MAG: glycoside hydrolase family 97 catalytic domain-containing protein [Verrucomicrobiota bacterium]
MMKLTRAPHPSRPILACASLCSALGVLPSLGAGQIQSAQLSSPDDRIRVSIQWPVAGTTDRPIWSATFRGQPILTNCGLGLQTAEAGELLAGSKLAGKEDHSVRERIPVLFGRADHADDHFNETRLAVDSVRQERISVTFRCYDDAIAVRYELGARAGSGSVTITDESTSFRFEGEPTAYVQYLENYQTSHEHNVVAAPAAAIRAETLVDLPLTLAWSNGTCAAITEAALRRYAGMALTRPGQGADRDALVARLTPRPDGTKVVGTLPLATPWRVVLLADRPGALLESRTIYCLNEPSAVRDVSWIKPGKITFSWWNGDVYDGTPGQPILSFAMAKKYIDFCAQAGLPIHSMTSTEPPTTPWYQQSKRSVEPGPDTDVTRPRAGFDLDRIRRYAEGKNIRLWTWVHQGALRGRVEEAFSAFERLGWSGMMVDFFDHDDQESVEFAEAVLAAAARHRILIHLHGIWKPTGWERTYPNLMNHEGALNLEYLKWSEACPPEHNVLMAYTRLIAGPMDYHLGGFRAVPRAEFKPRNVGPNVLGTRCHMLGLYVCFDNPTPMVADYPMAYQGQPGFEFIQEVPTWWDETRVVAGEIGQFLVTARRKGQTWYLGAISARQPRGLSLPLTFLGPRRYAATLWQDSADPDPNHLVKTTATFSAADALPIKLALDGGFVARFDPARE